MGSNPQNPNFECMKIDIGLLWGSCQKEIKLGLISLFHKAVRRGVCCQTYTTDELITAGGKKIISPAQLNVGLTYRKNVVLQCGCSVPAAE